MDAAYPNVNPIDVGKILDVLSKKRVLLTDVEGSLGLSLEQLRALVPHLASEKIYLEETETDVYLKNTNGFGQATLSWRCGEDLLFLPHCSSTNQVAVEMAETRPNLRLIVADHQTSGRGRMGRHWASNPGQNILMSVLYRPELPPERLSRCALILAAEVADELDLSLKWPNDLLNAKAQKVGGILCETREVNGRLTLVFGLGINVNQCRFDNLPEAASLRGTVDAPELDRAMLIGRLSKRLLRADLSQSLDLWKRRAMMLGKMVEVAGRQGIARDVRDDGALLIDDHVILAGDVSMVSEA